MKQFATHTDATKVLGFKSPEQSCAAAGRKTRSDKMLSSHVGSVDFRVMIMMLQSSKFYLINKNFLISVQTENNIKKSLIILKFSFFSGGGNSLKKSRSLYIKNIIV